MSREGHDELARGSAPQLRGFIVESREHRLAARLKNRMFMPREGPEELARGGAPQIRGAIEEAREHRLTARPKAS